MYTSSRDVYVSCKYSLYQCMIHESPQRANSGLGLGITTLERHRQLSTRMYF